nr:hypothetical protein B0A51_08841 [Rachicladosporium sp. CCFEE 5018]
MRRRLFWLEHSMLEDGQQVTAQGPIVSGSAGAAGPESAIDSVADSTTHTNEHEVNMVLSLVRHLIRHGVYRPNDIAVLTPYLGQLRKIRKSLASFTEVVLSDLDEEELQREDEDENDDMNARPRPSIAKSTLLKAVRLATVDNFQGEEAKVVIISLVRSNFMRKPGFVGQPNRANVLLSRAQHGMYIIGNPETFAGSRIWQNVINILDEEGNIGPSFELCCPRHPDTVLSATMPDDFVVVSPEAGCDQICGKELPFCGVSCPSEKACQICTTDEIKNMRADLLDMMKYGDVDLDLQPCIFTPCTHVFTAKSLDSLMGVSAHYELGPVSGMPVALKANSVPFSISAAQSCPDCGGSLHSLARYGRITRRARLDESTKQLVVQSEKTFYELIDAVQETQTNLLDTRQDASLGEDDIVLLGNGGGRLKLLKHLKSTRRYYELAEIRTQAREFLVKASTDELPFDRVYNMAENGRRKRVSRPDPVNGSMFDGIVMQTRGELLASALVLRCDVIAMTDLVSVWSNDKTASLYINLAADRRACEALIELAKSTNHPVYEAEAHILWATFTALES